MVWYLHVPYTTVFHVSVKNEGREGRDLPYPLLPAPVCNSAGQRPKDNVQKPLKTLKKALAEFSLAEKSFFFAASL